MNSRTEAEIVISSEHTIKRAYHRHAPRGGAYTAQPSRILGDVNHIPTSYIGVQRMLQDFSEEPTMPQHHTQHTPQKYALQKKKYDTQ